jgi:hypothetical protein
MTDIERPPSADRTVRPRVMVLLAGGVAALLTLVAARFSRPGVGPDAVAYLAVANNLHGGGGIAFWLEDPLTTWPPLWPALIALGMALSGAPADVAALALNSLAVAGCVAAGFALGRRVLHSARLAYVALVSFAISPLLIGLAVLVQTEVLFSLLAALTMLAILRWSESQLRWWLVAAGVTTAIAFYLRYQAIYVVPVFAGWIGLRSLLIGERSPGRALRNVLWYALPAAVPASAWVARNLWLSGNALGPRFPSDVGPVRNMAGALATTFKFLTSLPTAPVVPAAAIVLVVGVIAIVALERCTRPAGSTFAGSWRLRLESAVVGPTGLLATFVSAFTLLMVITRSMVGFDDLDIRLLAPCLIPTSLLFLRYCEIVFLDHPSRRRVGRLLIGIWLVAQAAVTTILVGPGNSAVADYGFNADRAVAASTSPALDALPPDCIPYSNNAGDLYHSGFQAQISPRKVEYKSSVRTDDLDQLDDALADGQLSCLVWVEYAVDDEYYSLSELDDRFELVPLASSGDVSTYLIQRR